MNMLEVKKLLEKEVAAGEAARKEVGGLADLPREVKCNVENIGAGDLAKYLLTELFGE